MTTTHPSEAEAWEWDDANEGELARHSISPGEVVEVWDGGPVVVPNRKHRSGDWKMLGLTTGGRALSIVVRVDDIRRTLRPITGWEMTPAERAKYFPK